MKIKKTAKNKVIAMLIKRESLLVAVWYKLVKSNAWCLAKKSAAKKGKIYLGEEEEANNIQQKEMPALKSKTFITKGAAPTVCVRK